MRNRRLTRNRVNETSQRVDGPDCPLAVRSDWPESHKRQTTPEHWQRSFFRESRHLSSRTLTLKLTRATAGSSRHSLSQDFPLRVCDQARIVSPHDKCSSLTTCDEGRCSTAPCFFRFQVGAARRTTAADAEVPETLEPNPASRTPGFQPAVPQGDGPLLAC